MEFRTWKIKVALFAINALFGQKKWSLTLLPSYCIQKELLQLRVENDALWHLLCIWLQFQNMNFRTHKNETKSKRGTLYLKNWASYGIFRESSQVKISDSPIFQISKSHSVFEISPQFLSSANEVSTGPTCQFLSVCLSVCVSFRSFFQGV